MKQYIYAFTLIMLALSCVRIEEEEPCVKKKNLVRMQLKASIDKDEPATKTYLDGKPIASVRNIYWLPKDTLAVIGGNYVGCFLNICAEQTADAIFDGEAEEAGLYYALYPYRSYPNPETASGHSFEKGTMVLDIPETQKYERNTFATDIVPMVARFSSGEKMLFKNVCGGLVLKLTGTEKIISANFIAYDETGADAPISGYFTVDMNSEQYELTPMKEAFTSVSIDCGEGVKLDEGSPTAFHIVLPPAIYKGFKATFASDDGKFMVIETDKMLDIRRSNITYVTPLVFENNIKYVDLSFCGTSNCYIVPNLGAYSFDATHVGNGIYGIVDDAGFHVSDPKIEPVLATILWQDRYEDVITNVKMEEGRVYFVATGVEGNALVAVKDAKGDILWSWHIWVTDTPKEQKYVNSAGVYDVLDRNLGATQANRGAGEEWKESMGTLYFWGRKDPFYSSDAYQKGRSAMRIEESVKYPTMSHSVSSWTHGKSSWVEPANVYLWSESQKTIYDPCPVGYRVATDCIWKDFTTTQATTYRIEDYNVDGGFDSGFNFYINESKTETAWYPITHKIEWTGNYKPVDNESFMWSANYSDNTDKRCFKFIYGSDFDTKITLNESAYDGYAYPVRCMKDLNYVNVSLPQFGSVSIDDITTSSAKVVVAIKSGGASDVIERGVIWGKTEDLSDGIKVPCLEGTAEFSATITGLEKATRYYVKAYAVNSYGENQGSSITFVTVSSDGTLNLSAHGTSNCYVISESYSKYIFDCTVKGNSQESIGNPVSLDVLWEANSCLAKAEKGEIISSVTLSGGFAEIKLSSDYKEGNALIAAKDAFGQILWSWHIWITDSPKEQKYVNDVGTFMVMDRNLGATRADKGIGDQWRESCGLDYCWGRKDPFMGGTHDALYANYLVDASIKNPTVKDNNWNYGPEENLWSKSEKTIYDPCPVGYRVAVSDVWADFSLYKISSGFQNGYYFLCNGGTYSWYPTRAYHVPDGIQYWGDSYMTAAGRMSGLYFSQSRVNLTSVSNAPLRCMTDDKYIDAALPKFGSISVDEITTSTARIVVTVKSEGASAAVEKGIIWSKTEDFSDGVKIPCVEGTVEFSATITGLEKATRYYVKAYAVNSYGEVESDVKTFYVRSSDSIENLSQYGTANCYIASPNGIFSFNGNVKGNSAESVGMPMMAEVIWETDNTSNPISVGDIITNVRMENNGIIIFETTEKSGNALIAVKDASGIILWSWHIWVSDYEPDKMAQTYASGAVMMDRNLGALNVIHDDVVSWGLFYQQGRKDPFVGCGNLAKRAFASTAPANVFSQQNTGNDLETIRNPCVTMWEFASRWNDVKCVNDPCPPGWKVPSPSVFAGFCPGTRASSCSLIFSSPSSTPEAYYPLTGDTKMGEQILREPGVYAFLWTSRYGYAFNMLTNSENSRSQYDENPVRCMKDSNYVNVALP